MTAVGTLIPGLYDLLWQVRKCCGLSLSTAQISCIIWHYHGALNPEVSKVCLSTAPVNYSLSFLIYSRNSSVLEKCQWSPFYRVMINARPRGLEISDLGISLSFCLSHKEGRFSLCYIPGFFFKPYFSESERRKCNITKVFCGYIEVYNTFELPGRRKPCWQTQNLNKKLKTIWKLKICLQFRAQKNYDLPARHIPLATLLIYFYWNIETQKCFHHVFSTAMIDFLAADFSLIANIYWLSLLRTCLPNMQ